ncbi:26S proteasome AAA-ATPase subunit [Guillardia theta]|uniref:26S proteasome AAA-ATPase subunit n=1 Tax=Guillardia theta TaxID=55529 RepID=Q9AW24_GUITH|nr:26S proteasome AAA-ATPase subunit [Guillardia theta]CAC27047.1 26S proteasome AAA-ATPase subunit [Guillardia theta]
MIDQAIFLQDFFRKYSVILDLEVILNIFIIIQRFIKNQDNYNKNYLKSLISKIKGEPISTALLEEKLDNNKAIISTPLGSEYYVDVCSFVDYDRLYIGESVQIHHKSLSIIGGFNEISNSLINLGKIEKHSTVTFNDIGGLETQILEIKEAIETPFNKPEIFYNIGIDPPKGVILYGEPGTGKTLLAKAIASKTKANFIKITGSELVQKFLGEGPRLVRDLFKTAHKLSPCIIFMDEIDAIGTIRTDSHSEGEKEVQRTMLELLNQLDGFTTNQNIKIIMATNRIDTLDPALIRPGRIDRKIEFSLPDDRTINKILTVHTKKMNVGKDVNLISFLTSKDYVSGADIKAFCTEAALIALGKRRIHLIQDDFNEAKNYIMKKKKESNFEIIYQ